MNHTVKILLFAAMLADLCIDLSIAAAGIYVATLAPHSTHPAIAWVVAAAILSVSAASILLTIKLARIFIKQHKNTHLSAGTWK